MIDMYSVALCAMIVMFGLMVALVIMLIKDQSSLSARQQIVEHRVSTELESFREQVKLFKRSEESASAAETAVTAATTEEKV